MLVLAPLSSKNTRRLGSTLRSNGILGGPLTVESGGVLAPGASPGTLTANSVEFQAGATLEIEIGGTAAETDFDLLDITGTASLAGSLHVLLIDLFSPTADNSFEILTAGALSGTFSTETLPSLSGQLAWNVDYDTAGNCVVLEVLSPLTADFDSDGDMDDLDLDAWQSSYGAGAGGDSDGDLDSDGFDFLTW